MKIISTDNNNTFDLNTDNYNVDALTLRRLSNVAEAGLWAFRVDGESIVSGGTYVQ